MTIHLTCCSYYYFKFNKNYQMNHTWIKAFLQTFAVILRIGEGGGGKGEKNRER